MGEGGFRNSQKFKVPTIIIFVIFWTGGKSSLDYLAKKYGNIGRYFCSCTEIFLEFYSKFDNNSEVYQLLICKTILNF